MPPQPHCGGFSTRYGRTASVWQREIDYHKNQNSNGRQCSPRFPIARRHREPKPRIMSSNMGTYQHWKNFGDGGDIVFATTTALDFAPVFGSLA